LAQVSISVQPYLFGSFFAVRSISMSMSNARLVGSLLLAAIVAQVQSSSAVLNAAAEAMQVKKAVLRSEPVNQHQKAVTKKVNIEVYYETRCPGCLLFISQTLEPLYHTKEVHEVLNVTMVTYGNGQTIPVADISEGYKFWHPETTGEAWDSVQICQHGSDECMGNLVQVCTKDIEGHAKHMELIFCMANTTAHGYGAEKSAFDCMKKTHVDHDKVRKCMTSPHGNSLINAAGKTTHALKGRDATPWVMIEGKHVTDEHILMNQTLLLKSVCEHLDKSSAACAPFHAQAAPKAADKASSDSGGGGEVVDDDTFTVLKAMKSEEFLEVSQA